MIETRIRSEAAQRLRYLSALQRRLDYLDQLMSERGEADTSRHWNRAERNALSWAINELSQPFILHLHKPKQEPPCKMF